jgi:hypothetical protein
LFDLEQVKIGNVGSADFNLSADQRQFLIFDRASRLFRNSGRAIDPGRTRISGSARDSN